MIALVDYGAGNLTSVKKALTSLGASFVVPSAPDECRRAAAVIVPGVGHFAATARHLAVVGLHRRSRRSRLRGRKNEHPRDQCHDEK